MKINFLTAISLFLCLSLSAQDDIASVSTAMLHSGDFDRADQYLDSILHVNPNTVDALMMKGNVILSRSLHNEPDVMIESSDDVSIYDETIGYMGDNIRRVDKETAKKVESLWQKCLQIAPDRLDIYQGLCTLYGMALMKDELIKELPKLVAATPHKTDELAYSLEDYAQALEQRYDFDGCMAVYKEISNLFPKSGGLMGDMAVMYQKHGMVKEWVECSRKAAAMKGNDFMTCYNIASLISLGADVEEGLRVFTTSDDASPMYIYYRGIIQFYHDDAAWRQSLKTYLNKSKKGDKDDGHFDLAEVMTAKDFKLDSAGYKSAMDIQPYELEYQLLSIKAKNSLSNNIYPTMQLADLYARKKCFEKAVQTLAEIKDSPKSATQDSTYRFHLAYVQYMSGDKKGSVENWKLLLNSGNFFRQSAACYFLGEIYKSEGKAKEAKELFEKVADRASDSKFANFCKAGRK